MKRLLAMAPLMLLANGCTGLHSSQGATQVYTLAPAFAVAGATVAGATAIAPTLQLARPLAAPGLDTERIALRRNGQRLDYYAASSWPVPLPELMQSLATDALRARGNYRAVASEAAAFAADEVLQLEIRQCQADYPADGPPTVHVQLVATLARRADRSLLATVSADSRSTAGENRMQSVVAAFQTAVADALGQLAAQLPAAP
jgi:cholesterol transport system auxiliary component